ncbi:MAG: aspartate kinase [Prolixibacteraceae bacterium]|nr:aspartate kinase [Prolixibacteraceae bacterium]
MKVLKFGGTSVGTIDNMNAVMKIVTDGEKKIIVLSAMSGTTNDLIEISDYFAKDNKDEAQSKINRLENKYKKIIKSLYKTKEKEEEASVYIKKSFKKIKSYLSEDFDENGKNAIIGQGELMSTAMFSILMNENGNDTKLLPALDFMRIDENKTANVHTIKKLLLDVIEKTGDAKYYVTQGFICRNDQGEIDNLQRGGSDYSASLIGAAIDAEEIQIWTDIDGIHNNDPRFVKNTKKIEYLSFNEAAELAYFGAKILHPQTILPAKLHNIPVRLKDTMKPDDSGTLISSEVQGSGIKAVAAKDGITAIKIRSSHMLLAYGFLKNIFEIFEFFKTPIDMISTSEVAVSLTIDETKKLDGIVKELKEYGNVIVDKNMTIICIVGNIIAEEKGFAGKVFSALEGIPIRMISYGGSRYNISILIPTDQKQKTLQAISDHILNQPG